MATTKVITELTDLNQANSTNGLRMPTGGSFSGTPAEGMMRNDTSQASEGSASTMQYYNGTDWKNFVNRPDITPFNADMLIVGGGGGSTNLCGAGGAGGGGVLEGTVSIVPTTNYSVQVGKGGTGSTGPSYSTGYTNGDNSFFDNSVVAGGNVLTANGGGYSAGAGGFFNGQNWPTSGNSGGSGGGGGGYQGNGSNTTGGASTQANISPLTGYGQAGGSMISTSPAAYVGAGGGGAGGAGQDVNNSNNAGGNGGVGHISTIITTTMATANGVGEVSGSDVYYAGGGGGQGGGGNGIGGLGGGGDQLNSGTASTGGGAGGPTCGSSAGGHTGGTGVLIIKYPDSKTCTLSSATNLTHQTDTTSISGFHVSIFTITSAGTNGTGTVTFT